MELWAAINEKPALRERVGAHPSLPSTSSWSSAQGTLFDELIKQYSVLVERADEMMVRQIYSEVETDLKTWITTSVFPHIMFLLSLNSCRRYLG